MIQVCPNMQDSGYHDEYFHADVGQYIIVQTVTPQSARPLRPVKISYRFVQPSSASLSTLASDNTTTTTPTTHHHYFDYLVRIYSSVWIFDNSIQTLTGTPAMATGAFFPTYLQCFIYSSNGAWATDARSYLHRTQIII